MDERLRELERRAEGGEREAYLSWLGELRRRGHERLAPADELLRELGGALAELRAEALAECARLGELAPCPEPALLSLVEILEEAMRARPGLEPVGFGLANLLVYQPQPESYPYSVAISALAVRHEAGLQLALGRSESTRPDPRRAFSRLTWQPSFQATTQARQLREWAEGNAAAPAARQRTWSLPLARVRLALDLFRLERGELRADPLPPLPPAPGKQSWAGEVVAIQPRVALEQDYVARGYVLEIAGEVAGEPARFRVGVGPAAQAKHALRVGDRVGGQGWHAPQRERVPYDLYKISKLAVSERAAAPAQGAALAEGPPWLTPLPPEEVEAHSPRWLSEPAYAREPCGRCAFGCQVQVDLLGDPRSLVPACYGPRECPAFQPDRGPA